MEGAAVVARASERLGFFDLPRELRDEIYQLSFSKSYNPPDNGGGLGIHDTAKLIRMPSSGGPSESHILQISRRMRFEAEEILFNDSTFCLHLPGSGQQSLKRELADRFMNLCIYIPCRTLIRYNYDDDHQFLNMFSGSRVGGKTCTIKFGHGLWVPDTCFFDVLKTFTGFETVRIQVSDLIPCDQQETWRIQDYLRLMKEDLECTLGHAMEFEDSNTGDAVVFGDGIVRGLEFHPQDRASAHNA